MGLQVSRHWLGMSLSLMSWAETEEMRRVVRRVRRSVGVTILGGWSTAGGVSGWVVRYWAGLFQERVCCDQWADLSVGSELRAEGFLHFGLTRLQIMILIRLFSSHSP